MTPDRALIAAVAAHPKDDAPRLACAEWLREHGSARGELIRAQLALTGRLDPATRLALKRRSEALLTEHRDAWMAPLEKLGAKGLCPSRGFIEEVRISEPDFASNGEELLAREPVLRVRLHVKDGKGFAQAVSQPWFEQVRWLKLTGDSAKAVDAAVAALGSAKHAGRLEGLLLASGSDKGLTKAMKGEALPGLRSLSLTGIGFSDEGFEKVFSGSRLTLTRLYLTNTGVTDQSLTWLADSKQFRTLEWLALNRNEEVGDEGAEALASCATLANLQRLELANTGVSAEGALAFRRVKALPALNHLDLSGNGLRAKELEPLRKRLGKGLKL